MEVFGKSLIFGDFNSESYGLMLATFSDISETSDETNITVSTTETFLGANPVPVYEGQTYSTKLDPTVTLVKNPCIRTDLAFTEQEIRSMLRPMFGQQGYQWMQIVPFNMNSEPIWYRARITSIVYQKISGEIMGITFGMECDSIYGWSEEIDTKYTVETNQSFYLYNGSDDLYNYLYPWVKVTPSSTGDLKITNKTDNNWATTIESVTNGEILTLDSKNKILTTSGSRKKILNYFNCKWIRLVPGKNEYQSNLPGTVEFKFREPRKAAFACN